MMILGATGAWADEITATLDHTAGAQWGSNTGASTVDAEKEHYNNDAASSWAGCAYAKFSYTIPEGHSITSAILKYNVNQGGRSGRDDIIYYMAKDFDLDWATFAGQTGQDLRNTNNRANKAVTAAPTGGTGDRLNLSQDVTNAVKAIFAEGQNYIIFQWTGNAGGADLYGKASDKAPSLIITTADASSVTSYTVKFTDGTNELKDAAVYTNIAIGSEQTASASDIASFIVNDKKYIYASGNTTITTVAEASSNVITLVFREAAKYNYTVKTSLGSTISEGTGFESDQLIYYFPQYQLIEGTLYETPAINKEYRYTTTLDTDNKVITVNYSATETTDVVFLKEAEDIEGATVSSASNANIRCSMGKGAFFANDAVVTTLQPGKYKLTAQVWGNATTTFVFKADEATILSIDTKGYIYSETSEEFEITKATDITIPAVGNENRVLDLVFIQKTGDLGEEETATFDFNASNHATSNNGNEGDITVDEVNTVDGVTMTITPSTTSTPNRYWSTNNGPQLRMYGGTMTIVAPEGKAITKVVFNNAKWEATNTINGEVSSSTWEGNSTNIVLAVTKNTQMNSVVVTIANVNDETTTYSPKSIANTVETAYTVAEAIALIDAGEALSDVVFVKGIVSQVDKFDETGKFINYWISDDGTTEGNQLEAYKGKGIGGAAFESINDIKVGATVIITGTITKYNDTYEFNGGNALVSYEAPAAEPELILTLQGKVGEEVSIKPGVYGEFDIFSVDFGDGVLVTDSVGHQNKGVCFDDGTETWPQKEGTIHTGITEFKGTVAGDGTIKVYGKDDIWYLAVTGATLAVDQPKLKKVVQFTMSKVAVESLDLTGLDDLKIFGFSQGSLQNINVKNNAALTNLTINNNTASAFESVLESLDLSGNANLEQLNVMGASADKPGKLTTLDLSNNPKLTMVYAQNNALTSVTLPAEAALSFINLQNNQIESIDLTTVASFKDTYLNNNKLAAVDLSKLTAGANLYLDGNQLTEVTVPVSVKNLQLNNNKLTKVSIVDATASCKLENNQLTLATIPAQPASMNTASKTKKFTYAPQAALEVAETVSDLDLSAYATVEKGELDPADYTTYLSGNTTFAFYAGETALVEGTDYKVTEPGKFTFIKEQAEKVYAVMTNTAFPKFAEGNVFKTTEFTVEMAEEPIFIDTDLTAQFPTDYEGWTGATGLVGWAAPKVMTNDGREVAACERYETTCGNTGDVFTRTLTGLANGTYRIELYGAAAFTSGRGFDSELTEGDETAVYLYAETASASGSRRAAGEIVKQYIPAHVATDFNGTGIATAVLDNVVITDGTVKIGMYKEKPYTNWHVVQIKGVTAKVDAVELHTTALAAAETALAAEECLVVTGEERTALTTAITNNTTVAEQTAKAYEAAIKALSEATIAFTDAKTAYQSLADAKNEITMIGYDARFPYAAEAKKEAAAATLTVEPTNAADATAKAAAIYKAYRQFAESHALLEGVEGAVNMTDKIVNPKAEENVAEPWTIVKGEGSGGNIDVKSNEPWTDGDDVAEHKYFDGGDWGANAWDVALQQNVTLPAGKYLLTVKSRASEAVQFTLFAGNETTGMPALGAAGALFNRGWNDASLEFELNEEAAIAIGVRGVTEEQHNWMSFSDFRLVQFPAEVVVTHTWDFTKWSEETVANLKADAAASKLTGWSDVEKKADAEADGDPTETSKDNCFWATVTPDENGELAANGVTIAELKGLSFNPTYATARSLAIAVNYPVALSTYAGPAYLWLGGGGKNVDCFVIKNVKAGTTIKMGVESHKTSEGRGVQLFIEGAEGARGDKLLGTDGNEVAVPSVYADQEWAVAGTEGDIVNVIVYNTKGCHIYYIDAEISETVVDAIKTLKVEMENGSVYNLNGQKVNKAQKGLYIINGKKVVIK